MNNEVSHRRPRSDPRSDLCVQLDLLKVSLKAVPVAHTDLTLDDDFRVENVNACVHAGIAHVQSFHESHLHLFVPCTQICARSRARLTHKGPCPQVHVLVPQMAINLPGPHVRVDDGESRVRPPSTSVSGVTGGNGRTKRMPSRVLGSETSERSGAEAPVSRLPSLERDFLWLPRSCRLYFSSISTCRAASSQHTGEPDGCQPPPASDWL